MSSKLLFAQLLAMGHIAAAISSEGSGSDTLVSHLDAHASAIAVGLAEPTSPNTVVNVKETSIDIAAPTPAIINGQDGDVTGPRLRQNLFNFRPAHNAAAQPCAPDRNNCYDNQRECERERAREREWQREHNCDWNHYPQNPRLPPLNDGPVRSGASASSNKALSYPGPAIPNYDPNYPVPQPAPYLRVTPSVVVQPYTHTHVETSTSTEYDVSTQLRTRTITEEVYSTQTHVFHPEHTFTIVNHHTYLEYPGSTIDPARVRGPVPTAAPVWNPPPTWNDPCY